MAHSSAILSNDAAPDSSLGYLHIPDMLVDWPWERKLNPLYEEIAAEGDAWFSTFSPFNSKSQHAFDQCKFSLCAALMYPDVPAEQLRTCVDMMNVFFLIDEYTDVEPAPRVREIVKICIDALHNPDKPRPDGEIIVGEVVRQFWKRGQRTIVQPNFGRRFVASFIEFLRGVTAHAEARDSGEVLTPETYRTIRLHDVGVYALYALWAAFHLVPDHLYDNPLHVKMTSLGCEMVAIDNDFLSYNREQALGDAFNIITATMHHNGSNLGDAAGSLVQRNSELAKQYMDCYWALSSALASPEHEGDEVSIMRRYLDHIGNIRRANWCWSFESGRYFGDRGSTYANIRVVPLIPKIARDRNLHEDNVDVVMIEKEFANLQVPV